MKKWILLTVISTTLMVTSRFFLPSDIYISGTLKLIASTGFILTALAAGGRASRYGKAILVGLFFSWWGDAFLIASSPTLFQCGLVSFLLGHVAYCVAFSIHGVNRSGIIRGLIIAPILTLSFSYWILPYVPADMKIPVIAYMIVITTMVILSFGAFAQGAPRHIPIGALFFFVSDIAVATDRFYGPDIPCYLWGLPLYFGGQLFLASSPAYLTPKTATAPRSDGEPQE